MKQCPGCECVAQIDEASICCRSCFDELPPAIRHRIREACHAYMTMPFWFGSWRLYLAWDKAFRIWGKPVPSNMGGDN